MASGPNPSPNKSLDGITAIVQRFLEQAQEAGYPIFAVVSAYQKQDGDWQYRTMLNGDSVEAVDAIYALASLLTPSDLEMLLAKIKNEHPEVSMFRQFRHTPSNGMVN